MCSLQKIAFSAFLLSYLSAIFSLFDLFGNENTYFFFFILGSLFLILYFLAIIRSLFAKKNRQNS